MISQVVSCLFGVCSGVFFFIFPKQNKTKIKIEMCNGWNERINLFYYDFKENS